MSEPKKKLPRANIAQAKAAWGSHPSPTVRSVAKAMREAGLDMPIATLQRWHKAGWRLKRRGSKPQTAAELANASANISDGVRQAEEKGAEFIGAEESETEAEREELRTHSVSDLSIEATKESLIAQILLSRNVQRRSLLLVTVFSKDVGKIIESLKGPASSTTIVMPNEQPEPGNGDGAKVVEGRLLEKSSTQIAIEAFQARRREGVAA